MNVRGILSVAAVALVAMPLVAAQAPPVAPAGAPGQGAGRGGQAPAAGPDQIPFKVYIRGGLKTHAEGQHDYPQFLADWSKILQDRGAIVDGGLHFPTAQELADVDVLLTYKGDAGYMTAEEKAVLETFLKRGGGLVALHDTICAEDPEWFSTIYGGAKKHGETNYTLEAEVPYTIADKTHPIMQGMSDFAITDEAFYLMTWSKAPLPQIKVLANARIADTPSARQGTGHVGEIVPQMWTYERTIQQAGGGRPYRAFVWMQGHNYANIARPDIQSMLLRAIAWTGRRPIDQLTTVPARGGGGGRGGRAGGQGAGAPAGRGSGAPGVPAGGRGN